MLQGALHLLPVDFGSAFMGWCWRLVAPHTQRHRRALAHLALAFPEKSLEERRAIALAMWSNLGRVFAESLMIDRIISSPDRLQDLANPLIEEIKSRKVGIVCVSLHTGNWELAVTPALRAGVDSAGVYQRLRNPFVDALVLRLRARLYPRGLFAKGPEIGRPLLRMVRQGGTVGMLGDLRERRGLPVPFFGRPARSTTFPALLARGGNGVLMVMRAVRLKGARFSINAEEIAMPRTGDREADIAEATRLIQSRFESWIREYPSQWMWTHRRWR